jgi:hypothetical protein
MRQTEQIRFMFRNLENFPHLLHIVQPYPHIAISDYTSPNSIRWRKYGF